MARRTMIGALATLAMTAGGSVAGAGAAQAAIVDYDNVELETVNFDFGSSGWVLSEPSGPGDLHWHHTGGQLRPHLTGTLHINNAVGDCARMRLDYLDADGDTLETEWGGTVCAATDQHHEWSVDLDPYASAYIDEVKVSVEAQTTLNGAFSIVDHGFYTVGITADDVKITTPNFDLGGDAWAFGAPTGDATMLWSIEEGRITPQLVGTLHLNNVEDGCARVNLRYLTESGTFITSRPGGTVCANDNGHWEFAVDLDPYESNHIGQVKVQLQTQNADGTYNVIGHQTVSAAA